MNIRIIVFSVLFVLMVNIFGYCQAVDDVFGQLKLELKNQGVSDQFIKISENSVKRMIVTKAKISDIKIVLLDLWSQGVKGRALKNAVAAVAELVASGDNVLEASSIASGAAHKAQLEGLSGFGVGMRVKKAVVSTKKIGDLIKLSDIQEKAFLIYGEKDTIIDLDDVKFLSSRFLIARLGL